MSRGMVERQVIVTWFTPAEKLPPEDTVVVCTINGQYGSMRFDRAIVLLSWCKDEGWYSTDYSFDTLEVLAWCDLDVYKG